MNDYSFQKSICEKYTIRWGKFGWAIFTIDENGLFNCQSDYGDYQYMWPNHGRESFKHFILELSRSSHYLLGKVAEENYFNFDNVLMSWKKAIIKLRKENEIESDIAREAWDFIHSLDDYSNSPQILQKELYENGAINQICSEPWYVFEIEMEYSPRALTFANEIMPMFADILRKEIQEGEKTA